MCLLTIYILPAIAFRVSIIALKWGDDVKAAANVDATRIAEL
jgi:hypothetical protein